MNSSSNGDSSNQFFNNDSKEELDLSQDGVLSPNTKIQNVKSKYHPNEMEEINEESVESDLTSSIVSKRLLAIKQQK